MSNNSGSITSQVAVLTIEIGFRPNNLPTDLVSYWPLDEAGNLVRMDRVGTNHLQPNGGVSSVPGLFGGLAANFGGGSYLSIADSQQTGLAFEGGEVPMSISLWINVGSLYQSTIGLLSKVHSNLDNHGYSLALSQSGHVRWSVRAGDPAEAETPAGSVRPGEWYHLAAVHDPVANQLRVYINGILQATQPHNGGIDNTPGSLFTVGVNSGAVPGADYFTGQMCDLAIWRSVLTPDQIQALAGNLAITTPSPLPTATVTTTYNLSFQASGGQTPYSWALASGTLPAGLTLSTNGVLSGTPTAAGNNQFSVKVTDANQRSATNAFQLAVQAPAGLVLTVGSATGAQGTLVTVPVRVSRFNGILTFQFSMRWNPPMAAFVGIEQIGLTGLAADNFGTNSAAGGVLTVAWDDASGAGRSLPDGATLFAARFLLTSALCGTSDVIEVVGAPTPIEAYDINSTLLAVTAVNGRIEIAPCVEIKGAVTYYSSVLPVAGVTVQATGGTPASTQTASNGTYVLNVDAGATQTLTPLKTIDPQATAGITTADIALIRRHILNIAPLDSPYKLLAVDVNNSQSISIGDVLPLRRLILGTTNRLPVNPWRFVCSDYVFPNSASPWNAPESRSYSSPVTSVAGQDYIAIKMGDVNNSWLPTVTPAGFASIPQELVSSRLTAMAAAGAAATPVVFAVGETTGVSGQIITVPVKIAGFNRVTSAQFTLTWDTNALALVGTGDYGLAGLAAESFGLARTNEGRLPFSWEDPNSATAADGTVAFSARFQVLGNPGMTTDVRFTDDPTPREVTLDFEVAATDWRTGRIAVVGGTWLTIRKAGGKLTLEYWLSRSSGAMTILHAPTLGSLASEPMELFTGPIPPEQHGVLALDNPVGAGARFFQLMEKP